MRIGFLRNRYLSEQAKNGFGLSYHDWLTARPELVAIMDQIRTDRSAAFETESPVSTCDSLDRDLRPGSETEQGEHILNNDVVQNRNGTHFIYSRFRVIDSNFFFLVW